MLQRLEDDGTAVLFRPDLVVEDATTHEEVGVWHSAGDGDVEPSNQIVYDVRGANRAVPVKYRFQSNADRKNQLELKIEPTNGGQNKWEALAGKIRISGPRSIDYEFLDGSGKPLGKTVTVYGAMTLDEAGRWLRIQSNGDVTKIRGTVDGGGNLLTDIDPTTNRDRVAFTAATRLAIEGETVDVSAEIHFTGTWQLDDSTLEFKVDGASEGKSLWIGFTYRAEAIEAGLTYFRDKDHSELSFHIAGRHRVDNDNGEVTWTVDLGYSAGVEFKAAIATLKPFRMGDGKARLDGQLSFDGQAGLKLNLQASYVLDADGIQGNVQFQIGAGPDGYGLGLQGSFGCDGVMLSFEIHYQHGQLTGSASLELTVPGNQYDLDLKLHLVLTADEFDKVKLTLQFSLKLVWINGQLVRDLQAA